ncbi:MULTISPECIES: hypothetical protein [Streptomyces]|uniref:hypothetical protein n=1 Tax=Streptomyces TaxID=1883 RepID=UPI00167BD973|nr:MULTISPECIES: hypothetical protein [Streptomyces]MBK3524182.1 hypothetical protein [Streptomyces sp. MBT70]GGR55104.1 hypothetical protein GCM10010236_04090 [Streptomyces eurythermus]
MTPHVPHPGTVRHTPAAAAPSGPLVIENLDVPAEQCGALFTVTYTHIAPAAGRPAA